MLLGNFNPHSIIPDSVKSMALCTGTVLSTLALTQSAL
jgi:hypothetical protein